MADTLTSTNELFSDPEFDARLVEWLDTRAQFDQLSGDFTDALRAHYDDGQMPPEEVGIEVSYMREATSDQPWEQLAGGIVADLLPSDAAEKLRLQKNAELVLEQATQGVVELGEQKGADQFAAYGLRRYLGTSSANSKNGVLKGMLASERRLRHIDDLVRANSGQLLTIMPTSSVRAGVLGDGGITIEGDRILFSQDKPAALEASFLLEHPELHEARQLAASTTDLDHDNVTVLQPSELLVARNWRLKDIMIFGDTHIEGPIVPVSPESWAAEEGTELLKRILAVGRIASSYQLNAIPR